MLAGIATVLGIIGLFVFHPEVKTFPFWTLLVLTVLSAAHIWDYAWGHNRRQL